jgi:hypothetical protein
MGAQDFPGEREIEARVPEFSFLDRLTDELAGSVCSVFGAAVERDGVTVIPVAKARWGLGGGSGAKRSGEQGRAPNVGGGGAAIVKPMGFVEMAGGRTRFRPILDPGLVAATAIASGLLGLAALQTVLSAGRPSSRARIRLGRRRLLGRRLRRLFR